MPAIKLKKAAVEQAEKEEEEQKLDGELGEEPIKSSPVKVKEKSSGLLSGLDSNILWEKRKRAVPAPELKLQEWIEANLEKKEEGRPPMPSLYECFCEACTFDGTAVVTQSHFNKRIFDKFGKAFGIKESSSYKGVIKEKRPKGTKPDTVKFKIKDIFEEAIKDVGNPLKGVRCTHLRQYIACNYPAMRLDMRQGYLKAAVERGVRFGYLQLVRGMGLTGYYRLPTDEEPDEEEEEEEKKKNEKPEEKKTAEEKTGGEGEADSEKQNGHAEEGDATEEESKKKSKKEKAPKEGEGEKGEEDGEKGEEGDQKKTKKKKIRKRKRFSGDKSYGSPAKIEDTFALAMTYMCEPKQTSFGKIKKYMMEHYPHVDTDNQLRTAMEAGVKKGFWDHVTGHGISGTFQLLIDEFNPKNTDSIEDMISSAIIACNEPKQASSLLLKKYVTEYHPEFNIEAKPYLFKRSLERAVSKQMIIRLSGIGGGGSFQMWSAFTPSPAILAGDEPDPVFHDNYKEKDEVYVPRGTKSRGQSVRKTPVERPAEVKPKPKKRPLPARQPTGPAQKSSVAKGGKRRISYAEESSDNDDEAPPPKKSRSAKKPAKAGKGKKKAAPSPKKSHGRTGKSKVAQAEEDVPEAEEAAVVAGPKKAGRGSKKAVKSKSKSKPADEPAADVEEGNESAARDVGKSKSKDVGAKSNPRKRPRPSYAEDDNIDDVAKSRGKSRGDGRRRSGKVNYADTVDDEVEEGVEEELYPPAGEEDAEPKAKSPKKKGRKRH